MFSITHRLGRYLTFEKTKGVIYWQLLVYRWSGPFSAAAVCPMQGGPALTIIPSGKGYSRQEAIFEGKKHQKILFTKLENFL